MKVRTRIAPSPTGDPHVGTAYMALFNLIFARHHEGTFVLRIEDTDRARSRTAYEKRLYEAFAWLGISWDEGPDVGGPHAPYRQSERIAIYAHYCQQLLDRGWAYKCFATEKELEEMRLLNAGQGKRGGYDRRYRNLSPEEIEEREGRGDAHTVRLKIPLDGECVYTDMVRGRISVPWSDVDDQILLKSDGYPTYHLANVVDDHLMGITHVIRGDEWMSSTPKHICLYDAFGWDKPAFLHMPLLLGADGKKLSKRRNPTSVFYYKESGYLQEALINFMTLMGYRMSNGEEIYSLDAIIRDFSTRQIGVSNAFFDLHKLDWINQHYLIHAVPESHLWQKIKAWGFSDERMEGIMPLVHTRIKTFGEFMALSSFLFVNRIALEEALLLPMGIGKELSVAILQTMIWSMEERESWAGADFEKSSHEVSRAFGVDHKKVVMPILFATLTGKHRGLPLFGSVDVLGEARTRARLLEGMRFLGGIANKRRIRLERLWKERDCRQWA